MGYIPIDPAGAAMTGTRNALNIANNVGEQRRGQESRSYMAGNGAGIMAGNQNALAGLMAHNPQMAMRQQQNMIGNRRADAAAGRAETRLDWETQDRIARMDARERAVETEKVNNFRSGLSLSKNQAELDQNLERLFAADPELRETFEGLTFDMLPQALAMAGQMTEALAMQGRNAPPDPDYTTINEQLVDRNAPGGPAVVPVAGAVVPPPDPVDEWIDLPPEELNARGWSSGQVNRKDGKKTGVKLGTKQRISVSPNGTMSIETGISGGEDSNKQDIASPAGFDAMISTVNGILQDEALDWSTGWNEWRQNIPGSSSKRFEGRVKQLKGQAFLNAFEKLKGGGQITEMEGTKATEAMGRLDTAQNPEDYRQALNEFLSIVLIARERQRTGGTITSNVPGVTSIEVNGATYTIEAVD